MANSSTLLLGLDFHPATGELLVIDFGNKNVLRVDPVSGASSIFTTIPGRSGIAFNQAKTALFVIDGNDDLWVAANQADEIVVIEPANGRAIAKLGDFGGIAKDGSPVGLLFPASLMLHGDFLYVSNLSLDLRLFNPDFNAVDSTWAARVTTHTVARIPRRLPEVRGLR